MQFDNGLDFPGLYSSDTRKNESDYSDDNHEKLSKKDLLIGKRKDKKDKGYATLEGESSLDEDLEAKSPLKSRRSNPFKFSSRKEKREKSHDKETKEKDIDKDKKKDGDKDKDKKKDKEKEKTKIKSKEKKKLKQPEFDISEELPIFGVPLAIAVERNPCHDGIKIPLVVRNCIDFIEKHGLVAEGVYKVTGVKSKVNNMCSLYNKRKSVTSSDLDLTIATSLLKQFLRSLPDPILTRDLCSHFENVTLTKNTNGLKKLIDKLPECNRQMVAWLFTHFKHVTTHEKQNKMNTSLLGAIFCPSLQMSPRLFNAFTAYSEEIFPGISLEQYVPPLTSVSPVMPESVDDLKVELKKQESLLELIHFEMNSGCVNKEKEDELWGVQRNITQIKRRIKLLQKESRPVNNDVREPASISTEPAPISTEPASISIEPEKEEVGSCTNISGGSTNDVTVEKFEDNISKTDTTPSLDESIGKSTTAPFECSSSPDENSNNSESSDDEDMMLQYERMELILLAKSLHEAVKAEKIRIEKITSELLQANVTPCTIDPLSLENTDVGCEELQQEMQEYNMLQIQKKNFLRSIMEEKEAIIDLKVQIRLAETKKQFKLARGYFNL